MFEQIYWHTDLSSIVYQHVDTDVFCGVINTFFHSYVTRLSTFQQTDKHIGSRSMD